MKNVLILIAGALILAGGLFLGMKAGERSAGLEVGSTDFNVLTGAQTAASTTVSTSASTQVVATSTSRRYLAIVNDGPGDVYLNIGNNAVLGKGILLKADGGSYEVNAENLFTGAVNAIASSSPANLTYIHVSR